MLRGYIPTVLASFFVCWLIVLMQFLWKYIDELVGKGLDFWVVAQILFYAAMTFLPMALPLGILLGSLIFFGNKGERLELLAMKAAGLSLYRMFAPLLILTLGIAVGLFAFQNDFLITSQVRMWTLLYSARFANLELEIPERIFYSGIPGYSIYVSSRDRQHPGRMLDVMIYDHKRGNEQVRIIRADSGRIVMDDGKTYLAWKLYNGQSFENLEQPTYMDDKPIAHAKERFDYKEIIIPFDANFQQMDDSQMKNLFIGKNLFQLQHAYDSATIVLDSIRRETGDILDRAQFTQRYSYDVPYHRDTTSAALDRFVSRDAPPINLDSLTQITSLEDSIRLLNLAISNLERVRYEADGRLYSDKDLFYFFRTNGQEWHRKFTFPTACLIFFIIGAPLGAIIRKGGLGMPVIASVLFFIIYYIIDTFGQNMTKEESVPVWLGMWLSSLVLLPIGLFLTYRSAQDSITINMDALADPWRKLMGTYIRRRTIAPLSYEEQTATLAPRANLSSHVLRIKNHAELLRSSSLVNSSAMRLWLESKAHPEELKLLALDLDQLVEDIRLMRNPLLNAKAADLPTLPQSLLPIILPPRHWIRLAIVPLLPLSLPLLLIVRIQRERIRHALLALSEILADLIPLLGRYAS
ncbi:MAG: LptF/LptG family permease [Porphyromonadaceae bacterium]|nr:LptF/LptG family permease [Porphyromonadaceae bacterium]